jgi:LysM repeat protein
MSQYTVKQGDTLWSIAEKLLGDGNKYSEIQRANNLRGDAIYPGQVLTIPGRGHSTTTHRTTKHDATKHGTTKHGATSDDSSDDTTLISVCNKVFSCKTFLFL